MGLLTRTFVPRSVRRATHPVRTVKRAATPHVVKQAQRSLHPVSNAVYSAQRPLNTKPRKSGSRMVTDANGNWQAEGEATTVPAQQVAAAEYVPNATTVRNYRIAAAAFAVAWVVGFTLLWGVLGMVVFTVAVPIVIAKALK